jgi:endonuclease/exonuclease/phosphatase family metal-dependent hydrolase
MASYLRRVLCSLLLLLTGIAALRIVAILGQMPWWLHDPLVYFPTLFYVLPGALLVLGLWRHGQVRPAVLRAALVVLGLNVAADVRVPPRHRPAVRTGEPVRLLTFNVYQTRLADDEIIALIRDRRPDILFLQEAPIDFVRSREGELGRLYRHVESYGQLLVATNRDVAAIERIELPHGRGMLRLTLDVRGKRLDVFNTHLSVANPRKFFPRLREQQRQVDALLDQLGRAPGALVAAGDFNFPLHSTGYKRLTAAFASARSAPGTGFGYTFNAFLPVTAIDHCFAGGGVRFIRWEPLPDRLSDHRPVEVEFLLPPVTP